MGIFLGWIVLSFVVAFMADGRKIGIFWALVASIFLSPLIGLIVVLSSKRNSDIEYEQQMFDVQKATLENTKKDTIGLASELEKLVKMKSDGIISEEEFLKLKAKLIN
ncbi:SHOCT domain-containing protein [Emticicia sp.]|uniref:SHOCT domain-containing protein n=1 Tax=Emticicia sp. TaxID=1930953 RepID=UPI0037508D56